MRAEQSSRKTNLECRIILEVEESSALELPRAFICQHSDAHYPIARQPLPPLKVSFFLRGGAASVRTRRETVLLLDRIGEVEGGGKVLCRGLDLTCGSPHLLRHMTDSLQILYTCNKKSAGHFRTSSGVCRGWGGVCFGLFPAALSMDDPCHIARDKIGKTKHIPKLNLP